MIWVALTRFGSVMVSALGVEWFKWFRVSVRTVPLENFVFNDMYISVQLQERERERVAIFWFQFLKNVCGGSDSASGSWKIVRTVLVSCSGSVSGTSCMFY